MYQWMLIKGATDPTGLHLVDAPVPEYGAGDVRIRVKAVALNFADLLIMQTDYMPHARTRDMVPVSDGTGVVEAVGADVTRFAVGDRVAGLWFQNWVDGPMRPDAFPALGRPPAPGMLAQHVVLPERGVTHISDSLSFEEAATLPCAGLTAWNALFEGRPVMAGESVLALGTGGVALIGLQFAKAAGARTIITSSSNDKLARVVGSIADMSVNYVDVPEWGKSLVEATDGKGAEQILETGGQSTLSQSMSALAYGGEIALIGVRPNDPSVQVNTQPLIGKAATLRGVAVGNGAMFANMANFIERHKIKPHIGDIFEFSKAVEAFKHLASSAAFGKVIIRID